MEQFLAILITGVIVVAGVFALYAKYIHPERERDKQLINDKTRSRR